MSNNKVRVEITGDASGFRRAVDQAGGSLKRLSYDLGKVQAVASSALSFAGLGGAASVAGLLTVAKSAADTADAFSKMSQRTGESVETLSRLAYAASLNDATNKELEKGLLSLSKRMAEGNKAFDALGISVRSADGQLRRSGEVFSDIADRFADMPDGAEKSAAAAALFGEEMGARLIPTLNNGSKGLKQMADEADRFGKTISGRQAQLAAEFNDNLTRLQSLSQGVSVAIGSSLVPAMNDMAEAFLSAYRDSQAFAGDASMETWAETSVRAIGFVVDAFDGVGRVVRIIGVGIASFAASVTEALSGNLAGARDVMRAAREDAQRILDEPLFSRRLQTQMSPESRERREVEANAKRREDLEKQLTAAVERESKLRQVAAGKASDEILKADTENTNKQIENQHKLRDALVAAYRTSVEEAKKASEESKKLLQSAADALTNRQKQARDKRESGLPQEERDALSRRRAEDLISQSNRAATFAQNAAFDGRTEVAKRNAEEALKIAQEAASEAERIGDNETAARLLEQIGEAESAAIKAQAQLAKQQQTEIEQRAQAQLAQIALINAELDKIQQKKIEIDIAEAASAVSEIQRQLAAIPDTKTVTIRVQQETAGGDVQGFAFGGIVRGPGTGTSDSILARLSNGEGIVNARAVRHYGADLIDRLNRMQLPRFAHGGVVGRGPTQGSSGRPLNLVWPDGSSSQVSASEDVARQIERAFNRAALRRGGRK